MSGCVYVFKLILSQYNQLLFLLLYYYYYIIISRGPNGKVVAILAKIDIFS